jgi:hypothetical protein
MAWLPLFRPWSGDRELNRILNSAGKSSLRSLTLHVEHIQPAVELETDALESTGREKSEGFMQAEACFLIGGNNGNDTMVAELIGSPEQIQHEGAPDAATVEIGMNVDGIFDRETVGGPGMKRAEGSPADDGVFVMGDDYGMKDAVGGKPVMAFIRGGGG